MARLTEGNDYKTRNQGHSATASVTLPSPAGATVGKIVPEALNDIPPLGCNQSVVGKHAKIADFKPVDGVPRLRI